MEQKIYVAGMMSKDDEKKVFEAVSAVTGVSNCTVNFEKAQVVLNLDETIAGLETAVRNAIVSCGFDVLG